MKKTIYRTVIRYEILSEEPIDSTCLSLKDIYNETKDGEYSGSFLTDEVTNQEVKGKKAVRLIQNQGSEPAFFQMDENGNNIGN